MARQPAKGGLNFKRWFKVHVWSALATFVLIGFLAITGIFIYPLDQFRLRDVHIQSALLPAALRGQYLGASTSSPSPLPTKRGSPPTGRACFAVSTGARRGRT